MYWDEVGDGGMWGDTAAGLSCAPTEPESGSEENSSSSSGSSSSGSEEEDEEEEEDDSGEQSEDKEEEEEEKRPKRKDKESSHKAVLGTAGRYALERQGDAPRETPTPTP